jgi:hypothetical protein
VSAGARAEVSVLGTGLRVRVLDAAGGLLDARMFHASETARAWLGRYWPAAELVEID